MITLKNSKIKINNELLLDIPKLTFNPGKMYLITGESGCGKTTLLYILGMLSTQYECEYYWNGNRINLNNDNEVSKYRKSNIGFLFQENNLMDQLKVIDNFKFYFGLGNVKFSEEKMNELLAFVNLDIDVNVSINSLSGGQLQRLAIACVLAKDPSLIICDEPTSSLDEDNKNIIIDLLYKIAHDFHKTVVIASHDDQLFNRADVVYEIKNKTIEANEEKDDYGAINKEKKIGIDFYISYIQKVFVKNRIVNLIMLIIIGLCIGMCLKILQLKNIFIVEILLEEMQ